MNTIKIQLEEIKSEIKAAQQLELNLETCEQTLAEAIVREHKLAQIKRQVQDRIDMIDELLDRIENIRKLLKSDDPKS